MKNILIVQNYNLNKGDSSVACAMIDVLQDHDVNLSITSYIPEIATQEYNINAYEWLVSYRKAKFAKSPIQKILFLLQEILWVNYSLIWLLLKKIGTSLWIPANKRQTIKAYLNADLVVLTGGHHYTNFNNFPTNFSHIWAMFFAQQLNKKTMMYAQTVGPFFGKWGRLTRYLTNIIIKKTDVVTLRESDSLKNCNGMNVFVTAESVFALQTKMELADDINILKQIRQKKKKIVGMTIHHIYYKHFYSKQEYISRMKDIINDIIDNYDCNVLLVPMESNRVIYNDRHLAQEIKELLNQPDQFLIIEDEYISIVIAAIIAHTDIFIGTKTHSIVYGLKGLVPTISISYQQKSTEFMKMFGFEENVITLKDLNIKKFQTIFDRVYHNLQDIRNKQEKAYEEIKEKSLLNKVYAFQLLSN